MSWVNGDGLYVKFGVEEGKAAVGGEVRPSDDMYTLEFIIDYTEVGSATAAIVDGGSARGPFGIVIPEGVRLQEMEVLTITAPTSSGTVASSTLVIGTNLASDRTTAQDVDLLATSSFVIGTVLESVGEAVILKPGATGAGVGYGTTTTAAGVIVAANSAHASHPYTAGRWLCKLRYFYPRTFA